MLFFSKSRFIPCKLTPILVPCFHITLGSANPPILKARTHRLVYVTLTLSPPSPLCPQSFSGKELHLRPMLINVREGQKWASIPHLHNDLKRKKLLTASGLHAWGTFLKTYCVYQGFCTLNVKILYLIQNALCHIKHTFCIQSINLMLQESDGELLFIFCFMGWNKCRMPYYNNVVVCVCVKYKVWNLSI